MAVGVLEQIDGLVQPTEAGQDPGDTGRPDEQPRRQRATQGQYVAAQSFAYLLRHRGPGAVQGVHHSGRTVGQAYVVGTERLGGGRESPLRTVDVGHLQQPRRHLLGQPSETAVQIGVRLGGGQTIGTVVVQVEDGRALPQVLRGSNVRQIAAQEQEVVGRVLGDFVERRQEREGDRRRAVPVLKERIGVGPAQPGRRGEPRSAHPARSSGQCRGRLEVHQPCPARRRDQDVAQVEVAEPVTGGVQSFQRGVQRGQQPPARLVVRGNGVGRAVGACQWGGPAQPAHQRLPGNVLGDEEIVLPLREVFQGLRAHPRGGRVQVAQHVVLVPQPLPRVGPVEDQTVVGTGLLEEDGAAGPPVAGPVGTTGVAQAHRSVHLVVADQDRARVRLPLPLDEWVRDSRGQVEGGQP